MILTIGNTKGGVGKTATAVSIAISRAASGRNVWLIDGDRQGSAMLAMTIRAQSGRLPFIKVSQLADGKQMHKQVTDNGHNFDDVVIDVGGRDSSALRAALVLSDVLLIPFQPRSLDVWALKEVSDLVTEAVAINKRLKAFAFLSCADTAGGDNRDAVAALGDYPLLGYLDAPIVRRKSVANAVSMGLSVAELTPKDDKAIEELKTLVDLISNV